jgi:hypothetical protein
VTANRWFWLFMMMAGFDLFAAMTPPHGRSDWICVAAAALCLWRAWVCKRQADRAPSTPERTE